MNGGYIHLLSDDELKILQDKLQYKNLLMLVIDEISTVDPIVLAFVNARLQQVYDNEEPFGGTSIMFVGDLRQLLPIGTSLPDARMAYAHSQQHTNPTNEHSSHTNTSGTNASAESRPVMKTLKRNTRKFLTNCQQKVRTKNTN